MNAIEQRLMQDIAAVTRGIVVTDSDLQEARTRLDGSIERSRRRRSRVIVAFAAAAAVAAVGAVIALRTLDDDGTPKPLGPPPDVLTGNPTPQLLEGVWRVDNDTIVLKFSEDGTVTFDAHGTLFSDPDTTGTYAIKGDLITVTITQDGPGGCAGSTFAMRASLPKAGSLEFYPADDSLDCATMPPAGFLEQQLPTRNESSAALAFTDLPGFHRLTDKTHLYGDWLAEGGGYILEMDRDGSYYVADASGEVVDRGEWGVFDSNLTLTSSADSPWCSAGDRLYLGGLEEVNPGTFVIRGSLGVNTCGGGWTPAEWIQIPHRRS